jgi:hypothetical protein
MNNWHNEFMAEYHRRGILEEAEQVRLERIALKSRVYRPGFYARTMFSVANWMISIAVRNPPEVLPIDLSPQVNIELEPRGMRSATQFGEE